jgi:hypothetical protein
MSAMRRALLQSVGSAAGAYLVAGSLETTVIRLVQPTEYEFVWISDVALAADIQRRLLPALPAADGSLECAAALRSAGTIGGDFYDFVEAAPGVWLVLIADVSGKGIPAAMALGSLRSTFRTLARQRLSPARVVSKLSSAFLEEWDGTPYITCIVALFNLPERTISYSNAGHPPGVLLQSGIVRRLHCGGPPAGLVAGARFEEELLPIFDGDTCLLVTDGVTEALDHADFEHDVAASRASAPAALLCESLMQQAMAGSGRRSDGGGGGGAAQRPSEDRRRSWCAHCVVVTTRRGGAPHLETTCGIYVRTVTVTSTGRSFAARL